MERVAVKVAVKVEMAVVGAVVVGTAEVAIVEVRGKGRSEGMVSARSTARKRGATAVVAATEAAARLAAAREVVARKVVAKEMAGEVVVRERGVVVVVGETAKADSVFVWRRGTAVGRWRLLQGLLHWRAAALESCWAGGLHWRARRPGTA